MRWKKIITIRLLRDFNDKSFTKHPSEAVQVEDKNLWALVDNTKTKFNMGLYVERSVNCFHNIYHRGSHSRFTQIPMYFLCLINFARGGFL